MKNTRTVFNLINWILFYKANEPKDNTAVQRSWLPFKDKALIVAEDNLGKTA